VARFLPPDQRDSHGHAPRRAKPRLPKKAAPCGLLQGSHSLKENPYISDFGKDFSGIGAGGL
jgi:hypothetical protein